MKSLLISILLLCSVNASAAEAVTKIFGVHLFFNEKGFVDELKLTTDADGQLSGHMHVPDDFDSDITNIVLEGTSLSFDVLVPKNLSRTQDAIFHYKLNFFDDKLAQAVGFVTVKGQPSFVASLVAFLR